jgi:hypothetical protein
MSYVSARRRGLSSVLYFRLELGAGDSSGTPGLTPYRAVVTVRITCFNIKNVRIFPAGCMLCVVIPRIGSNCLPKQLKPLVFLIVTQCIYCEVGTEYPSLFLYIKNIRVLEMKAPKLTQFWVNIITICMAVPCSMSESYIVRSQTCL